MTGLHASYYDAVRTQALLNRSFFTETLHEKAYTSRVFTNTSFDNFALRPLIFLKSAMSITSAQAGSLWIWEIWKYYKPGKTLRRPTRSGLHLARAICLRVVIVSPDKVEVQLTNLTKGNTMTTATIALAELAEKGSDIDVLRQMVQFMAQRLMDMDIEGRCGAGYDEKNTERLNSRNGYRERT